MKDKIAIVLPPGMTKAEVLAELGNRYDVEFVSPGDPRLTNFYIPKPETFKIYAPEPDQVTAFNAPLTRAQRRARERKK